MFNNTIDNKPTFTKNDGTVIKDLTKSCFNFTAANNTAFSLFKIPRQYIMRPDLISQAVYNDSKYAEVILKYNGISNPLTVDENDVIMVPNLDVVNVQMKPTGEYVDAAQQIRQSYLYIDPLKIPKTSTAQQAYNNQQKQLSQPQNLPPNIAPEGETAITYRNGRVYFGENVTPSAKQCLKNGQTTSEFLATIIKAK